MSHITDILLCTAIDDGSTGKDMHPNADKLNEFVRDIHGNNNLFKKIELSFTKLRCLQSDVFVAAVNGCEIDKLITEFKSIKWQYPESAQILIKDEDDDRFELINYLNN